MSEEKKRNPSKGEWNHIYELRAKPENQDLSVEQFWPVVEKYINENGLKTSQTTVWRRINQNTSFHFKAQSGKKKDTSKKEVVKPEKPVKKKNKDLKKTNDNNDNDSSKKDQTDNKQKEKNERPLKQITKVIEKQIKKLDYEEPAGYNQQSLSLKIQAMFYVVLGFSLANVSKKLAIPFDTLAKWSARWGWVKLRPYFQFISVYEKVLLFTQEQITNEMIQDLDDFRQNRREQVKLAKNAQEVAARRIKKRIEQENSEVNESKKDSVWIDSKTILDKMGNEIQIEEDFLAKFIEQAAILAKSNHDISRMFKTEIEILNLLPKDIPKIPDIITSSKEGFEACLKMIANIAGVGRLFI